MSFSFSAMKVNASSHEMRLNCPGWPFGLVRSIGYLSRSGSRVRYTLAMPFAQREPMLFGDSGLPFGLGAQHGVLAPPGTARRYPAPHPFRAARADVVRRFGVALVIDDFSVAHHDLGGTLPRTRVTEALDDLRTLDLRKPLAEL